MRAFQTGSVKLRANTVQLRDRLITFYPAPEKKPKLTTCKPIQSIVAT
jgi:hypothetical protein